MEKPLFKTQSIGLNAETKRRIAIILQGTNQGSGINIKQLKFSKKPEQQAKEIVSFIKLVNRNFEGILQLVQTGDLLVPIIINSDAIELKRRSLSSKVIAMACIILLHEFINNQGPTLPNLEKKFQITKIKLSEIKAILRELNALRWIIEKEELGIKTFNPTPVMKACIPIEMLQKIYSEIYNETPDKAKKTRLEEFLPLEYVKVRKNIRTIQKKLFFNPTQKSDKEKILNNNEGDISG